MNANDVTVFFYGGLINPAVQARVGLSTRNSRKAILYGYALSFEPWVNLIRTPGALVHGLLMDVDFDTLMNSYRKLAARYLPYPVECEGPTGERTLALCFLAPAMEPGPIDHAHVQALVDGATECGFPSDYIDRIRAFLPN